MKIAVVGAGIAGLAAAWELTTTAPELHISVFESAASAGGKLRTSQLCEQDIDAGAESVLARRPEATGLISELGLVATHPARVGANIVSRGSLCPMPSGTLMGVPSNVESLAGLLTPAELERARNEVVQHVDRDIALGVLVQAALGPAVVDRLLEPLLGGVYAGQSRQLSAQACLPALWQAAMKGESLSIVAQRTVAAAGAVKDEPVFASVAGGTGALANELVQQLRGRGVRLSLGSLVRSLHVDDGRWSLEVHHSHGVNEHVTADAVVVATPAAATARLLRAAAPRSSAELSEIDYASMALVTYALPTSSREVTAGQSGFLVPPVEQRHIKAATFSTEKWPWLAQADPEHNFVRVSFGRHQETATLQRSDAELAHAGLRDLTEILGHDLGRPDGVQVQRWGGGLPQYKVGHAERIRLTRAGLGSAGAPITLAGAAYDGVGIPACIASGRAAAAQVLTHLSGAQSHG